MKDMTKIINRIMEKQSTNSQSARLNEAVVVSASTVEPQTTVGVDNPPVLSQCHHCMGVYHGDPQECPICGAPANQSVRVKESRRRRRESIEDLNDRKAISAEEFAKWHEAPENYKGKDAQVKMDKIYAILDKSKTTSDSVYDQYKDLPEKDKEEITRLIFNESQDDFKLDINNQVKERCESGGDINLEIKDKIEECDATDLLECGEIEKFNEKYGTSTLARNGKLQIIAEAKNGRKFVIEKSLNPTQRAAYRVAESARKLSSKSVVDRKRVSEAQKSRISAMIRNEARAARIAATRYLEMNRISFDAKKLRESVEDEIIKRSRETEKRINEVIDTTEVITSSPESLSSGVTEVIEDTGLNVVSQEVIPEDDGSTTVNIRVQDEPGVEVNLQEVANTIEDVLDKDVTITGPLTVAGDSTLADIAITLDPVIESLEEVTDKAALSESLRRKLKEDKWKGTLDREIERYIDHLTDGDYIIDDKDSIVIDSKYLPTPKLLQVSKEVQRVRPSARIVNRGETIEIRLKESKDELEIELDECDTAPPKLSERRRRTEARKAMTAEDFAEWHKNPDNYNNKDAQVKMDKIYSILDKSHTTSDDIYDQYKDLDEKDKEEITRLVYNESKRNKRHRLSEDLSHGDGEKVEVQETETLEGIDSLSSKESLSKSEILVETISKMSDKELEDLEEALRNRCKR